MQLVGLKAVYVGEPLAKGVKDTSATTAIKAFTKITQPYKGGVSFNFSNPSSTKFYREGESNPFEAVFDPTSGEKTVSWNVADFGDEDMQFYFGTTEPEQGKMYEGKKAFVFVAQSGSIAFANLKFAATLSGNLNTTDPLQIAVTAEVLAPTDGGVAWWPIPTPEFTNAASE